MRGTAVGGTVLLMVALQIRVKRRIRLTEDGDLIVPKGLQPDEHR